MALVIRAWNVFHGNTDPPGRRAYLRQMIELVTRDRPDIVCLQELPVWSLARLAAWSGMRAVGFSPPLAGSIGQIYVRSLTVLAGPRAWPVERRGLDGGVLSDHAPVEAVVG